MRNFKLLGVEIKIRNKEKEKSTASPAMRMIIERELIELRGQHRAMSKQLSEPIKYPTAKDARKGRSMSEDMVDQDSLF